MTPAKLQELARQAGAIRLIDAADPRRKTPWSLTDAALAKFAALVRVEALEEAARAIERRTAEMMPDGIGALALRAFANDIRELAQQAGGEQGGDPPC